MTAAYVGELALDPYADAELRRRRDMLESSAATEGALEQHDFLERLATWTYPEHRVPAVVARRIEERTAAAARGRAQELELAAYMERHSDPEIRRHGAKKMACHAHGEIYVEADEGGTIRPDARIQFMWEHHCRERRTCPHESRTATREFTREVVPACRLLRHIQPGSSVQYWVCSPPNVPAGELAEGMRDHARQLGAELSRMCRRGELLGAFVVCEYPLARDGRSWNVHFNVLAVTATKWSARWSEVRRRLGWHCWFQDEREMLRRTAERMRREGSWQPELTRARILERAMLEVVKYAAKMVGAGDKHHRAGELDPEHPDAEEEAGAPAPALTEYPPDLFAEWWYAGKAFRRARSYGLMNAQRKLGPSDYQRWPRLRPYEAWIWEASTRVQGARLRAQRERQELSRDDLAARVARELGEQPFRWVVRLQELEPGKKRRQETPPAPLSEREAQACALALGVLPASLTRLQGASVPEIMRRLACEQPWPQRIRAGVIRWHQQDGAHRALFLIQAANSDRRLPPELANGPRAPP